VTWSLQFPAAVATSWQPALDCPPVDKEYFRELPAVVSSGLSIVAFLVARSARPRRLEPALALLEKRAPDFAVFVAGDAEELVVHE